MCIEFQLDTMASEKAGMQRYNTMTRVQVVVQCSEFAIANGTNANVVHRRYKLARGGDANAPTKTDNSGDGSIAETAHQIEVGGCGLAYRTAPRHDNGVHFLAEQRYSR